MLEDQVLVDTVLSPMIGLFGDVIYSTQYCLYDQGYFVCRVREINLEGEANVVLAVQFFVC